MAESPIEPITDVASSEPTLTEVKVARSGGGGFRRFMRRLVKTVIVLAIVGGIGAGVYYAWPVVNERYVQPVAANTDDVAAMQEQMLVNESRIADQEARIAELEQAVAERLALVETLEGRLAELDGAVGAQGDDLGRLDEELADLNRQVAEQSRTLAAIAVLEEGLANAATKGELARQLDVLKSAELMARARLFLYQGNYGLARQDIREARDLLVALDPAGTPEEQAAVDEAVARLELALDALPQRPVAASDDLDIAWSALLGDSADFAVPDDAAEETATQG